MRQEGGYQRIRSVYSFWGKTGLYGPVTFLTFLGRERSIRKYCVERLELNEGDSVLDIACGTGRNHPYLIEAVGTSGGIVALDYSPEMLDRAKQQAEARGWHNISFVLCDAANMEFPEEAFDGVLCVLGMSVVPRHEEAIRRAVASLKPAGRIVICDAVPFKGMWRFLNPLIESVYGRLACWDPQKDIISALKRHTIDLSVQWFNGGSIYVAAGTRGRVHE